MGTKFHSPLLSMRFFSYLVPMVAFKPKHELYTQYFSPGKNDRYFCMYATPFTVRANDRYFKFKQNGSETVYLTVQFLLNGLQSILDSNCLWSYYTVTVYPLPCHNGEYQQHTRFLTRIPRFWDTP